ncbi:MAG: heparinase II/III family protein [Candidatus Lokiarchaeota archaeon]|nr:heparinase II/III family protein [Candidatus Lokiarchaeota archaeon]
MKISKRWRGIIFGVLNVVLIVGPLVYLAIYPNLQQEPSSYSESLFFSLLDETNSTLAIAKRTADEGDLSIAKSTLLYYFRNRPPDPLYRIQSYNLTEEMNRSNLAMERIFNLHGKTLQIANYPDSDTILVNGRQMPNTNWHKNPYPQDDEWIWQFSRWSWIQDFARAYIGNIAIGNTIIAELYARECIDLITDFIQKEPVGSSYTWRTLDSAYRVQNLYGLGDVLKNSTYFTSEFCFLFLRFIADHGRYIADFHKTQYNWAFTESKGLLTICGYLDFFTPTRDWEQEVWNTLSRAVKNSFYPDGASREHAFRYHMIAVSDVRDCLYIADQYEHLTSNVELKDSIQKSYLFLLHNTMPDHYGTTFGDSHMRFMKYYIGQGTQLFPLNLEFSYFDSEGEPIGIFPPNLSVYFNDIGVFLSRTAWNDTDALFTYFDGGSYGEHYHQHQDFGNLQLYGYGRRLILDPGVSSYTNDLYSNYFRQSYSHNVVLFNNNPQSRAIPYATQWTAGLLGSVARASTKDCRYIWDREVTLCNFRGTFDSDLLESASNSSDLNRYWVVSDFWHGREVDLTMLWHLPYANLTKLNSYSEIIPEFGNNNNFNIRTDFENGNIGIYGFGPWNSMDIIQNGTLEQYKQPFGIRADRTETGYWEEATTLRYQGSINGKFSWFTVLYPSANQPYINVTRIPFSYRDHTYPIEPLGNAIGNVFSVTTTQGEDLHISLMNPTEESLYFEYRGSHYQFHGQQVVLHFNSTHALTQMLAGKLDRLVVDGNTLFEKQENSFLFAEDTGLDAITIHIDSINPYIYIGNRPVPSGLFWVRNNALSLSRFILGGEF